MLLNNRFPVISSFCIYYTGDVHLVLEEVCSTLC